MSYNATVRLEEKKMVKTGQLAMRREGFEGLPRVDFPFGYLCRTFRAGDEAAWCEIIEGNIGERWTADKFEEAIYSAPQFDPEGIFFVMLGGRPVGTACAWRRKFDEGETGTLHMVAVKEEHRGRGIGSFLTRKVLEYFRERGFRACELTTDDERLGAIKTYLNLGFRPVHTHENHKGRWEAVYGKLGLPINESAG